MKLAIAVLIGVIIVSYAICWKSIAVLYGHVQSLTAVSDHIETGEVFHSAVHSMLMIAEMAHDPAGHPSMLNRFDEEEERSKDALMHLQAYADENSSKKSSSALVENTAKMALLYKEFRDITRNRITQDSHATTQDVKQAQDLFDSIFQHYKNIHNHHREQRAALLSSTKNIWISMSSLLSAQIVFGIVLALIVVAYVDRVVLRLFDVTERLALHDQLTGLFNRHALSRFVGDLCVSARSDYCYSVILLDIDHFKTFNDKYGHDAGDAVLIALARTIQGYVRGHDKVIRYGGEEILVLLPRTNRDGAMQVAEGLRETIACSSYELPMGEKAPKVTISAGVASGDEGASFEAVVKLADARLYGAKSLGRNRVCAVAT